MKKMWLMSLAIFFVLSACNKEDVRPTQTNVETTTQTESSSRSDCDPFEGVELEGDMLSFSSNDHVIAVLECLQQQYDEHQDAFEAEYGDLPEEEEFEEIEESLGFDDYQPLRDFENVLGHASLRNMLEQAEEEWLDNEELDLENNPSDHAVVDEVTQTIFNEAGQLLVAGELVDANELEESDVDESASSRSSCKTNRARSNYINYSSNRLMKWKIALRSYPWGTYAKAKTKSYKKKRRRWKKYRRRVKARPYGTVWDKECNYSTGFSGPLKSKWRKSVTSTQGFWRAKTKKHYVKGYHYCNGYNYYSSLTW